MFNRKGFFSALILIAAIAVVLAISFIKFKKPWYDISNFVCYYGGFDERILQFDLAIIDTDHFGEEQAKQFSDSGTYLIGRITPDSALIKPNSDGLFKENENFIQKVMVRADYLNNIGLDGFYLSNFENPVVHQGQTYEFADIVKALDEKFQSSKIVISSELDMAKDLSDNIDGFVFEEFSTKTLPEKPFYSQLNEDQMLSNSYLAVKYLFSLQRDRDIVVFTLDYYDFNSAADKELEFIAERATEIHFVPYIGTKGLREINFLEIRKASEIKDAKIKK